MTKANWKEAPHDAETYEQDLAMGYKHFCKPGFYWGESDNKWFAKPKGMTWSVLEHRPRTTKITDMKVVAKCITAWDDGYTIGEEYTVGTDAKGVFGPLGKNNCVSPALQKYTFELIGKPIEEPKPDPRICIDVSSFNEAKKKRVIDAFYALGYKWAHGDQMYRNLDAKTYTNVCSISDPVTALLWSAKPPRKGETQYKLTYKQLMQRAYGKAGHPDERCTHTFSGIEGKVVGKMDNGELVFKAYDGQLYSAPESSLKPIKPTKTKDEAFDWLASKVAEYSDDSFPTPSFLHVWKNLLDQFEVEGIDES